MPLSRTILLITALLMVLSGCETLRPSGIGKPTKPPPDQAARTLLASGKFKEAAAEYLRLAAAARAPWTQDLRLRAAGALIRGNDIPGAKQLLAATAIEEGLPEALHLRKELLWARIALAEHRPDDVLNTLPREYHVGVAPTLKAELHRLRALAFTASDNPVEATRERVLLELQLTRPEEIAANRQAIWETLTRLPESTLSEIRIPPPDTLGGWIELAAMTKRYGADPATFATAVEGWQLQYPGHPANQAIVQELMEMSRAHATPPRHIALLLPFEGPFAKAAEAVRDGFLTAWFSDGNPNTRPSVTIRDTTAADIRTVYTQAVKAGADFVVGPLEKPAVNTLANTPQLPVPTLALNYVDVSTKPREETTQSVGRTANHGAEPNGTSTSIAEGLYQFALSPEAEAQQVAERAWFDGHVKAGVLTPQGPWGQRVAQAFIDAWERIGGVVVAHQTYPDDAKDMSDPVKRLLNLDESEKRWRALKGYLKRNIKYEARRRQDIDFIFMAAFSQQARQLRPQLRFHRASDIPVYATSHVYSGTENPAEDRDIDGVSFGDMPWVVSHDTQTSPLREHLAKVWPESMRGYPRLYAFGVDAYRIIPHLRRLRAQGFAEFDGVTGRLSVREANRVHRQLLWAYFQAGTPHLYND